MATLMTFKSASGRSERCDSRRAAAIRAARAKTPQPGAWGGPRSAFRGALRGLFSRGEKDKNSPLGKG